MKTVTNLTIDIINKFGDVRYHSTEESKSFVRWWTRLLYGSMANTTVSVTDTGNTSRTLTGAYTNIDRLQLDVGSSSTILVGTGTTAATKTDYAIETEIADGGGAGELNRLSYIVTETDTSTTDTVSASRTFSNSSGGTINVTECVVYAYTEDNGGTQRECMLLRDTFSVKAVADGEAIVITYDIESSI